MHAARHPLAMGLTMLACMGCAAPMQPAAGPPCLVDLTHTFDETTVYWPTASSRFQKTTLAHGTTEGGYFYSAYAIAMPEHGGTHVDAPFHFARDGSTTDEIPIDRLIGPGVVIDMSADAAENRDALLSAAHIEAFEREHGPIASGVIVLVRTGWAKRWPSSTDYLGSDAHDDVSSLHFPGISEEAAHMLVARRVAAVGIDTASLDHGPSQDFRAHRVLMAAGIPGFENVAALDHVPAKGARIMALPMKIGGGSGGPLRIVAEVPSDRCRDRAPHRRTRSKPTPIDASKTQLLTVVSDDWDASRGTLRRYEREPDGAWRPVGQPFEVVLGYAGYGWGRGLHGNGGPEGHDGPRKQEGDGRSPAGVFDLGSAYGYGAAPEELSLPYVRSTPSLRCIDDPASVHYNRIVSASQTARDWQSAELMLRKDDLYSLAIVVEHNIVDPKPGAGSCIFLHVWTDPDTAVRGCTAMAKSSLDVLSAWLEPGAAVLVALPEPEYRALAGSWKLPPT